MRKARNKTDGKELLANSRFKAGETVEVVRGKSKGSFGTIEIVDYYYDYDYYNYREEVYLGYTVNLGGVSKKYREGSIRECGITDEDVDVAKEGLMATLKELMSV